jgi:serine/threonine-protein kinase
MGEVWRGVDVGWGGIERPVAVKVIAPSFAREPDFVRTFVDEARLSYLLCHSNVVNVRDIGLVDNSWFIAMEWVEGGDLGGILRKLKDRAKQPLPMRFCVLVAVEAARGLDYAHRLRDASGEPLHVVHRDISPSNLLVSFEGEVKITDFGIARSRMKTTPSLPGALKGKIGYLAPEQARGDSVDQTADLFALGVVLYEMLTGANPFTHNVTEREAMAKVLTGAFQAPRVLLPAIPQGLEAIVLRAMARDPADRYATCGAMREDLETLARREGYALSAADLGAFVRDLLTSPAVDVRAKTDPALARISKPRITSPKPFDVALGESLAQLSARDEVLTEAQTTIPGKRIDSARSVAAHPVIGEAIEARAETPGQDTEQIPRSYSQRTLFGGLALVALGVAVGLWAALGPKESPVAPDPPALPVPPVAVVPSSLPKVVERIVPPPEPRHGRPRAPEPKSEGPARLSVDCDVAANLFVDGQFVHVTPLSDLPLEPGTHNVRAESSESGLRLIPREEIVVLKAGESRHLTMDLK